MRRKFFDLAQAHQSPIASQAIERIAALYAIEKEIRGKPPDERAIVRQSRARPLLDEMRRWLDHTLSGLSRKSETALAIRYALARWRALTRYVDDGSIEMDNNAAERSLRACLSGSQELLVRRIGQRRRTGRSFLLADWHGQAERLDPELYLRQLLERIGDHPINRIADLLPWNFAPDTDKKTEPSLE